MLYKNKGWNAQFSPEIINSNISKARWRCNICEALDKGTRQWGGESCELKNICTGSRLSIPFYFCFKYWQNKIKSINQICTASSVRSMFILCLFFSFKNKKKMNQYFLSFQNCSSKSLQWAFIILNPFPLIRKFLLLMNLGRSWVHLLLKKTKCQIFSEPFCSKDIRVNFIFSELG